MVFKLAPDGAETVLHRFPKKGPDGKMPSGGLAMDGRGYLFGATTSGGSSNQGTVF